MAELPPARLSLWETARQVEQELYAWSNPQKLSFDNWSKRINQAIRANKTDSMHPRGRLVSAMQSLIVVKDGKTKQERLNTLAAVLFYAHRMLYEQNLIIGMELNDNQQQLLTLRQRILDLQIDCSNPETIKENETLPKLKDVVINGVPDTLNPNSTSGPRRFYVSAKYKGTRPQENYVHPATVQTGSDHDSEEENPQQGDTREGNEGARRKCYASMEQKEGTRGKRSDPRIDSPPQCQSREGSPDRDSHVGLEQRFSEMEKQMQIMQEAVSKLVPKRGGSKAPYIPVAQPAPMQSQE